MTDKELRGLSRRELVEILCRLKRENNTLRDSVRQLETRLSDRKLKMEKAGTLAEAMVSISGVLEAAQKAADWYLEEIRRAQGEVETECEAKLTETEQLCRQREAEADMHISAKWRTFEQKVESFMQTHSELEALEEEQSERKHSDAKDKANGHTQSRTA